MVVLGVLGYTGYHYYGDQIKAWSKGDKGGGDKTGTGDKTGNNITKDDFKGLGKPGEPDPKTGVNVTPGNVGPGKLGRQLVVGINTWAGHTPGIIANGGLDPAAG